MIKKTIIRRASNSALCWMVICGLTVLNIVAWASSRRSESVAGMTPGDRLSTLATYSPFTARLSATPSAPVGSKTVFSCSAIRTSRRAVRYLIPQGYIGWICVEFNVQGTPPLPLENGYYLLKFPRDGWLQTSSKVEYGWAKDEYYYYSVKGRHRLEDTGPGMGGLIWNASIGSKTRVLGKHRIVYPTTGRFFVGTEQQANNAQRPIRPKRLKKGLRYIDSHRRSPN